MPTATVGRGTPAMKPGVDGAAVKRLFQEDGYRQETKAAFEAHNRSTAGKDILERCKRLNEFLESDFLKGGGPQSKEQLKEILGMLNAAPKRPSFLDKPPVTATASKAPKPQPAAASSVQPWGQKEAEQILSLLECQQSDASTSRTGAAAAAPSPSPRTVQQHDDMDDVIGLLNSGMPSKPVRPGSGKGAKEAERMRKEQEARALEQEQARKQAEAEQERREQEAKKEMLAQEQAKKQQQEQERLRREQEERERLEAEKLKRKEAELQRQKAAEAKLKQEEELRRRAREEEERRRKEEQRLLEEKQRRQAAEAAEQARVLALRRSKAAVTIQALVRMHHAIKRRRWLREQLHAAVLLQAAERARAARQLLHGMKVEAFRRRHAARCIAACYKAYKARWHLGPVRARNSSVPGVSALDGHAHLLALPLRLRSTADTRLAPESPGSGAGAPPAGGVDAAATASGKRTALTARRRAGEMAKHDGSARSNVGARAVMAGSEHRDFQEAMQAVKASGAGTSRPGARASPGGMPLPRSSPSSLPRSLPTSRPGSNDSSSRARP